MRVSLMQRLSCVLIGALPVFALLLWPAQLSAQSSQLDGERVPFRLNVMLFSGPGVSDSSRRVEEDLQKVPEIRLRRIRADQINSGVLEGQHVVIFSGGSGSVQGRGLGEAGRERVRKFVESGGGYVGICAGAYLASADYEWSLHLLDARVLDRRHWARGFGNVEIGVAPAAAEALQVSPKSTVYYHQGPLLAPAGRGDIPDYREWAVFLTEVRKQGVPGGVMQGTTAIAAGEFGAGRVLAISPHLERTDELNHVLPAAVRWAAAKSLKPRVGETSDE
jgi:putative intracellular protease/amidase